MRTYNYKSPTEIGYTKFRLTKKKHNTLFPRKKKKWMERYEYFYNEEKIILHKFINWKGILLATLLFPITVLLHGIVHFKEMWQELMELYNQKQTGSFVSDFVYDEIYEQVMNIILNSSRSTNK